MKKSLFPWVSIVWLPASIVFAQAPSTAETPRFDRAKSAVTVIFAPDYGQASPSAPDDRHAQVNRIGNFRSLDTPASQIVSAMTNARINRAPVQFPAPEGLIGVRTGAESAMAAAVTVGDGGKLQFQCGRLPEALEGLKTASSASHSSRKGIANDK